MKQWSIISAAARKTEARSVPNFVGMTAAAAYQMMVGENPSDPLLSLGTVTYEQSGNAERRDNITKP